MQLEDLTKKTYTNSICVGTGYLVLDVVMNGHPQGLSNAWAGGSCGNVLTILSYLGWNTYPIARLGKDEAAEILLCDLAKWNVNTNLIWQEQAKSTPIIIQKTKVRRDGTRQHQFKLTCPNCGAMLPRYRTLPTERIEYLAEVVPYAPVFYFDRVRHSTIKLAKLHKERGSLIFFEPSNLKNKELFLEGLRISDIVKYSDERLEQIEEITQQIDIPLEIETLGAYGLRYRFSRNEHKKEWIRMPAFPVNDLIDAAGSGDWCSAGIIHLLGKKGKNGLREVNRVDIESALKFGQALAALNCYYEGARGIMYNLSKQEFAFLIDSIIKGSSPTVSIKDNKIIRSQQMYKFVCPNCEEQFG